MFLEVILNGIGFPFQRIQLENYINFSKKNVMLD